MQFETDVIEMKDPEDRWQGHFPPLLKFETRTIHALTPSILFLIPWIIT